MELLQRWRLPITGYRPGEMGRRSRLATEATSSKGRSSGGANHIGEPRLRMMGVDRQPRPDFRKPSSGVGDVIG
jgi:hypothetical protein